MFIRQLLCRHKDRSDFTPTGRFRRDQWGLDDEFEQQELIFTCPTCGHTECKWEDLPGLTEPVSEAMAGLIDQGFRLPYPIIFTSLDPALMSASLWQLRDAEV